MAGGNGAAVSVTGVGGVTATAIGASGGAATTTNANGGNAGSITINNSGSGNTQTTTLTSQAGNAAGTGTGGTAGSVSLTNTAATGNISTTTITTAGATNAHGGNVLLSSLGNTTVTGTITTSGGAAGIGVTAAGRNAGSVTITGVNRSVTGNIAANGAAGLGTDQVGGNAGLVSITGSGTLGTAAINSRTGNATGVGTGGTIGNINLTGTTVTAGALTTTGGNNGNAGNIGVTSTTGNMSLGAIAASGGTAQANTAGRNAGSVTLNSAGTFTGTTIAANGTAGNGASQAGGIGKDIAITVAGTITATTINASGGNAGASGNANGGNAGNITLDAGGATPNINLGGNITATGGNRIGAGTAGTGGAFWAKDATTNTANVTVNTTGGTGGGAGGIIRFDGALNEDATARTLTLTAGTGTVTLAGGTATNALTTLASTGASNTLGSVQTKGAQTYTGATNLNGALATLGTAGADTITFNSPTTLTGNSSLTTAGGAGDNIAIGQTINGNFNLALNAGVLGNVTTSAVIGGATPLNGFSATGAAVTFGRSVTANSIFGRSTTGDLTLNTGGTVLNATGTGNALELVAGNRFINNVGAAALNASNGAGRFLVWSQNPANDTRGGLAYNFKQYNATYGVTTVADSNFNNNGFLYTTAPTLNATVSGVTKQYNGTVAAALTAANFSAITGTIDGDTVLTSALPPSGTYDTANVGTSKTINVTGTANGTNGAATVYGYQVGISSAGGTITKADISVSTNDVTKTYNGSTDMTGATGQGAVLVAGTLFNNESNGNALDNISGGTFTYTDKNFGINNKTVTVGGVTVSDGNSGGNYNVTYVDNTNSTINKANITLSTNNVTKTYNGSTDMTGATGQGAVVAAGTLFAGDSLSGGTFAYTDKNFGIGNKTVTTSGVTVTDGVNNNNYNVGYQDNTTSTINKKDITAITGITANNKVYDGNASATLNTGSAGFTGIVGGETLSVGSATGVFNSKNVVSANIVNISGLTLADGADLASNYNLTNTTASDAAVITAKDITAVTGITANNKVYDGNASATLNTGSAGFTGIVGGETLSVGSATGVFNSKNVVSANIVNISGLTLADGADLASNYNLTNTTASDAAVITAKDITAVTGITANDKVYDGTTAATLNTGGAGFTGIVGGESLTVGTATGTFNSKDVLTANSVNITGITLADGVAPTDLASNYNLTNSTASDVAVITPRSITITADAGQTKFYGSVDPIFTFTIGGLGLGTGDALSGNLNRVAGEVVGNYAINPGTLALPTPSNYLLTYVSNDFGILQPPPPATGLPNSTAGLVDLNPKLGTYTGTQLFILSLAPSAAGGDGTDAALPECESNPDKLAKDKDFSIMINYGLNLPKGLNNTCI